MVVLPGTSAFTLPFGDTLATAELELRQVTLRPADASVGVKAAASCPISPTRKVSVVGLRPIETMSGNPNSASRCVSQLIVGRVVNKVSHRAVSIPARYLGPGMR